MFMLLPPPPAVTWVVPFTVSELTASTCTVPVPFMLLFSSLQSKRISCLEDDEVTKVRLHGRLPSLPKVIALSSWSLVKQDFVTLVCGPLAARAFMAASNWARWSGESRDKSSSGMGGTPLVCVVRVDSHRPSLTSSGL